MSEHQERHRGLESGRAEQLHLAKTVLEELQNREGY